jgi:uncharacterized protein (DUF305 family)
MKKLRMFLLLSLSAAIWACAGGDNKDQDKTADNSTTAHEGMNHGSDNTGQPAGSTGTAGTTQGMTPAAGGDLKQVMATMMQRMQSMQMTNDPDHDFAAMMRDHHQGAVEMAQIEVRDGKDAELKAMAQKMIADQQAEIAQFDRILANHKPSASNPQASQAMMAAMKNMGMGHGSGAESLDHDFADMMIPHHQSAINMAKTYLPHSKNDELKQIAQKIVQTQTVEIGQLQTMMKRFH